MTAHQNFSTNSFFARRNTKSWREVRGKEDEKEGREGGKGRNDTKFFFFTICGNTCQHTNKEVIVVGEIVIHRCCVSIAILDGHGPRH